MLGKAYGQGVYCCRISYPYPCLRLEVRVPASRQLDLKVMELFSVYINVEQNHINFNVLNHNFVIVMTKYSHDEKTFILS